MVVPTRRGARTSFALLSIAPLLVLGCDSGDKKGGAGSHPDAGHDAGRDAGGMTHPDGGSTSDSGLDASATPPPMPTVRAQLEGRDLVLEILSDQDLVHDACEPLLIEKYADRRWQPRRDERPPRGSGQSYYLDGEFVARNDDACAEVRCKALDEGIRATAEEFVQTGTKRPPAGEPNPETPVFVVETRPLIGQLRLTAHYDLGQERCGPEPLVATAELMIPTEGVCCPIGPAQCPTLGPGGGWAKSYDQCPTFESSSGIRYTIMADDHGCPVLVGDETRCCGDCPMEDDAGI
jgi:hypothetical protein